MKLGEESSASFDVRFGHAPSIFVSETNEVGNEVIQSIEVPPYHSPQIILKLKARVSARVRDSWLMEYCCEYLIH